MKANVQHDIKSNVKLLLSWLRLYFDFIKFVIKNIGKTVYAVYVNKNSFIPTCLKPIEAKSNAAKIIMISYFLIHIFNNICFVNAYKIIDENKAGKNQVGPNRCSWGVKNIVFFITTKIFVYLWFNPKKFPWLPVRNWGYQLLNLYLCYKI